MSNSNYIIGGRGSGKTRKLLEYAKAKNALVICKNPHAMARKAEAYGIFGLRFVSYIDTVIGLQEKTINNLLPFGEVVIDEIKEYFDYLLSNNCIGFTLTEDD